MSDEQSCPPVGRTGRGRAGLQQLGETAHGRPHNHAGAEPAGQPVPDYIPCRDPGAPRRGTAVNGAPRLCGCGWALHQSGEARLCCRHHLCGDLCESLGLIFCSHEVHGGNTWRQLSDPGPLMASATHTAGTALGQPRTSLLSGGTRLTCPASALARTGPLSRHAHTVTGQQCARAGRGRGQKYRGATVTPTQHTEQGPRSRDKGGGFCWGLGVASGRLTGTGASCEWGAPWPCLGRHGPLWRAVDGRPLLCPLGLSSELLPCHSVAPGVPQNDERDPAAEVPCLPPCRPGFLAHTCPPRVGVREDPARARLGYPEAVSPRGERRAAGAGAHLEDGEALLRLLSLCRS